MRRTLAQALAPSSRICESLNILSTDSRAVAWINGAIERLLPMGHWFGTCPKYTVNVTNQLFSLPPQFATIEQIAVCRQPINLRNNWFEFSASGWGVVNDPTVAAPNVCVDQVLFRGNFPLAQDIISGNQIRLQCDVADDIGVKVLFLGFDVNGNWVRSKVLGIWQDGETIAATQSPGTLSTTVWGKITDIQKPISNGQMWVIQASSTAVTIGTLNYWETNPSYGRYLLPTTAGITTQIDLAGKLCFIPVVNPTDYLIIGNLGALRLACQAVKYEEEGQLGLATLYLYGGRDPKTKISVTGAVQVLQEELQHYRGDGAIPSIQVVGSNIDGGCGVEALL